MNFIIRIMFSPPNLRFTIDTVKFSKFGNKLIKQGPNVILISSRMLYVTIFFKIFHKMEITFKTTWICPVSIVGWTFMSDFVV
jgi:hypothetical protein